ncbi:hypothetical protein [Azotobacter salinestris]|uniref:hypothetical protein n=1 Tax=Azotobacter salinestris TaxID=69964 RepID=UPI0032DFC3DF
MRKFSTSILTAYVLLALTIHGCANAAMISEAIPTEAVVEKTIEASTPSAFIGRWSSDCEKFGGIHIYQKNNILIEVNSNQIYVRSHGEQNQKNLSIFLDAPDDLGRGGMMLPWNKFSNEKPIAEMTLNSETYSQVIWHGFYNKETNTYEWATEPDFLGNTLPAIFNKCE